MFSLLLVLGVVASRPPSAVVLCGKSPLVQPAVLKTAQREASGLFRRDGFLLEFVDTVDPSEPRPLQVVLFGKSTSYSVDVSRGALGFTFVGEDGGTKRVSVLFCDRVEAMAGDGSPERLGRALGRAMAHEIAHMLRGKADHSSQGLLKAEIPWNHWLAPSRDPFYLATPDARAIRLTLSAITHD